MVPSPEQQFSLSVDLHWAIRAGVYVRRGVSDNRFVIAGGSAGMEVSWQVTGIRADAWALANPLRIEEEKTGNRSVEIHDPEMAKAFA